MDRRVFFYSLLVTFFIIAFSSLFFLFPAALQRQNMPFVLIGWLMSIASISSLLSRPVGSYLTERLGIKRSLLLLCLLLTVVSLPLIWARTFASLFFIRVAIGCCFGMVLVAIMAYQALIIPIEQRGSIYAWVGIAYVLPQLIVIPPAEFLITAGRFDIYMAMAPLFTLLSLFFVTFLPANVAPANRNALPAVGRRAAWGKWADVHAIAGFWPLVLGTFVFAMLNATTLLYIPAFINDKGLVASAFLVANGATAVFWRVAAYKLMNRMNRRRAIGLILIGMGVALFLLRWADSNGAFIAGGILYGTFMGVGFPVILALVPDVFPERLIPKGVSISTLAMDFGFILAPILAGYLGQRFDLGVVFVVVGTGGMLSGLGVFLASRRKNRG